MRFLCRNTVFFFLCVWEFLAQIGHFFHLRDVREGGDVHHRDYVHTLSQITGPKTIYYIIVNNIFEL